MRYAMLLPLLFLFVLPSFSQDANALVKEGIALHDNGEYDAAIQKYNAALALDRDNYDALYEKAYSLLSGNKYSETIELCKYILKKHKANRNNGHVYITMGTSLDLSGKPKDAIKMYDEGIKLYPQMGLLYFNKAITLNTMNEQEEALRAIKLSITNNPYHGSSHHFLNAVTVNKTQALMSSLVLLAIEPAGKRGAEHLQKVQKALAAGAKKTGENQVTINLDMLSPSSKRKQEDDFSTVDMLLGLNAALDFDDKFKDETSINRVQRKLESLFAILGEANDNRPGFGWTHYAPFFAEMKKEKHVETFTHIIHLSVNDASNNEWLEENADKVTNFETWFKTYWSKK